MEKGSLPQMQLAIIRVINLAHGGPLWSITTNHLLEEVYFHLPPSQRHKKAKFVHRHLQSLVKRGVLKVSLPHDDPFETSFRPV